MTRPQSPGYPNFPLEKALDLVKGIFAADRRSAIDRETAAKHIGYGGLSGAADKTLATLAHYGLLERAGKGQTKVTQTAIDILHPDSEEDRRAALMEAAFAPAVFEQIKNRFDGGKPSEAALRSWLVREGFLDRAIGPVAKSYMENYQFLEQEKAFESGGDGAAKVSESPMPDSDPSLVRPGSTFGGAAVGDFVQWESQGVLQFQSPKRVRWVSDDGTWLAVEGSDTGMPMEQVTVESAPKMPPQMIIPPQEVKHDTKIEKGFSEWFRAKVGPDKLVTINFKGEGEIGPREIEKMIKVLEAQRLALED